ncbi:FOG: GGDEF domain [Microbacterium sp. HM58-2]|nr:FOG: GGDEF domain [Microbacterium sp. HM58-2]
MKDQQRVLSTGDTLALALFAIIGVGIAVTSAWMAALRIAELTSGGHVQVLAEFVDTAAQATAGEETLPVLLDRGVVTVDGLMPMGVASGVLGQITFAATVVGVVFCLLALSRNLLRGVVFGKVNTGLVMGGGIVGLIGAAASRFFDNMLANAAIAQVTDGSFDTAVLTVEPFPYLLAAFALSIIGTVFVVGDRLRRETEGLV